MPDPPEAQPSAADDSSPRPTLGSWLHRLRQVPSLVYVLVAVAVVVAGVQLGAAYDSLNKEDPDPGPAKFHLQVVVFTCLLIGAGSALVWGRGAGWLAIAVLAGLWLQYDRYYDLFQRWGMNWSGAEAVNWTLFYWLVLTALAAWAFQRGGRKEWGSRAITASAAALAAAWFVVAVQVLSSFDQTVEEADAQWTADHADPALGWIVVAVVLLGGAVWRRRLAR